jgi:hypothetical protein
VDVDVDHAGCHQLHRVLYCRVFKSYSPMHQRGYTWTMPDVINHLNRVLTVT